MGSVTVHRAQNCMKSNKKIEPKTLAEFPEHILNDYDRMFHSHNQINWNVKNNYVLEIHITIYKSKR